MRKYLSDRNLVIVLFILVLVTFSFAHEDSKKLQQISTQQTLSADNSATDTQKKLAEDVPAVTDKNSSGAVSR
ncbi:MAG TPA: hypothetical protein VHD35_01655 [Chitinophagaceae bacterium]|nr:hypothetical protein [Chitinophagaceae bacterium]